MTLHDTIKNWITCTLAIEGDFVLEYPADMVYGDFASNVAMVMAKNIGKNPRELAEEFAEKLRVARIPEIFDVEVAGPGFINFTLSPGIFSDVVEKIISVGPTFGEHSHYSGKRIIVEYTQPNVFKEFHVGHMMNNVIGEAVSRLIEAEGAEVIRATYHGDVGLHVAKAVWGLQNMEVDTGVNVKTLGQAYALGAKLFEIDGKAKEEIIAINKKIYEKSDDEINLLYEKGREISLHYFESMYTRLGSTFDHHFYESQSGEMGKKIVLEYLEKGIFEKSDGAVIFPGEKYGLHTRVFLNSEGLPTYEAKEVGLMHIKQDLFSPFDQSITVTANEQNDFFRVVEKSLEEIFPELHDKLLHLSHGVLKLPSGKMSSRTGDVLSAENIIDMLSDAAREKIKNGVLGDAEKNDIAETVALGALKFTILRQAIGGDIVFDKEKALSLDGDSGPYLQYATVRAKSILVRAKEALGIASGETQPEAMPRALNSWKVTNLERLLERFPSIISRSAKEYAPHYLVTYVTELASEFNSFYASHKIIDLDDPTSLYKVSLTRAFVDVMTSGLHLLGIKVPEEM